MLKGQMTSSSHRQGTGECHQNIANPVAADVYLNVQAIPLTAGPSTSPA